MFRVLACWAVAAVLAAGSIELGAQEPGSAQYYPSPTYDPAGSLPTLDYNYYYPSYATGQHAARLYLAPRPVPPHVGYTWITYPPLAPHEFLWVHNNAYIRYHADGGYTITTVRRW